MEQLSSSFWDKMQTLSDYREKSKNRLTPARINEYIDGDDDDDNRTCTTNSIPAPMVTDATSCVSTDVAFGGGSDVDDDDYVDADEDSQPDKRQSNRKRKSPSRLIEESFSSRRQNCERRNKRKGNNGTTYCGHGTGEEEEEEVPGPSTSADYEFECSEEEEEEDSVDRPVISTIQKRVDWITKLPELEKFLDQLISDFPYLVRATIEKRAGAHFGCSPNAVNRQVHRHLPRLDEKLQELEGNNRTILRRNRTVLRRIK